MVTWLEERTGTQNKKKIRGLKMVQGKEQEQTTGQDVRATLVYGMGSWELAEIAKDGVIVWRLEERKKKQSGTEQPQIVLQRHRASRLSLLLAFFIDHPWER